jgi:hypothetical protein
MRSLNEPAPERNDARAWSCEQADGGTAAAAEETLSVKELEVGDGDEPRKVRIAYQELTELREETFPGCQA